MSTETHPDSDALGDALADAITNAIADAHAEAHGLALADPCPHCHALADTLAHLISDVYPDADQNPHPDRYTVRDAHADDDPSATTSY